MTRHILGMAAFLFVGILGCTQQDKFLGTAEIGYATVRVGFGVEPQASTGRMVAQGSGSSGNSCVAAPLTPVETVFECSGIRQVASGADPVFTVPVGAVCSASVTFDDANGNRFKPVAGTQDCTRGSSCAFSSDSETILLDVLNPLPATITEGSHSLILSTKCISTSAFGYWSTGDAGVTILTPDPVLPVSFVEYSGTKMSVGISCANPWFDAASGGYYCSEALGATVELVDPAGNSVTTTPPVSLDMVATQGLGGFWIDFNYGLVQADGSPDYARISSQAILVRVRLANGNMEVTHVAAPGPFDGQSTSLAVQ